MAPVRKFSQAEFKNFRDGLELLALSYLRKHERQRVLEAQPFAVVGTEFPRRLEKFAKEFISQYPESSPQVTDIVESVLRDIRMNSAFRFIRQNRKQPVGRPAATTLSVAELILWVLLRTNGDTGTDEEVYEYLKPNGGFLKWWSKQTANTDLLRLPALLERDSSRTNWKSNLKDQLWRMIYKANGGRPSRGKARTAKEKTDREAWFLMRSQKEIPPISKYPSSDAGSNG